MNIYKVLTVSMVLINILLVYNSYEKKKALDSCIYDVTEECAGLFGYASELEEENARLNNVLRECRALEGR
tara:strand:- start:2782 stop:2994 length:213 start_codon:yes stop_codon:yes gene_type:complete